MAQRKLQICEVVWVSGRIIRFEGKRLSVLFLSVRHSGGDLRGDDDAHAGRAV